MPHIHSPMNHNDKLIREIINKSATQLSNQIQEGPANWLQQMLVCLTKNCTDHKEMDCTTKNLIVYWRPSLHQNHPTYPDRLRLTSQSPRSAASPCQVNVRRRYLRPQAQQGREWRWARQQIILIINYYLDIFGWAILVWKPPQKSSSKGVSIARTPSSKPNWHGKAGPSWLYCRFVINFPLEESILPVVFTGVNI